MMTRVLFVVAAVFLSVSCQQESKAVSLPPSPSVKSSTPAAKPVVPVVPAAPAAAPVAATPAAGEPQSGRPLFSGTTEAHRKSTLTPKVASPVTRVHVRDGDVVKEGQPLVTLDTQDFQLRFQQAEAALEGAKVQVDSTKLEWDRIKALLAEKAVPQSQFDMVDARLKGAQAGLRSAETAVAMGRKALRDATVRSPFAGIVVKRFVNEGEYASVMPATQLVSVEEIDPIDLRIQIPATDMTKVHQGDAVRVHFSALNKDMDLRLTRVVAASDPRTRTFTAIVEIPNPDHLLRSGLYAEVKLTPDAPAPTAQAAKPKKTVRKAKD
jgi:RND family efflux transporter MFP subunit